MFDSPDVVIDTGVHESVETGAAVQVRSHSPPTRAPPVSSEDYQRVSAQQTECGCVCVCVCACVCVRVCLSSIIHVLLI